MSDTKIDHSKKHPKYIAYHVRQSKDGEKGFWSRIGVVWEHKDVTATEANGTAERTATLDMLDDLKSTHDRVPMTLGGDKGYDDGDFFGTLEGRRNDPQIQLVKVPVDPKTVTRSKRRPGIRARRRMKRRMGTEGYRLSQRCRKKVEECFGWLKSVARMGRSRVVGRWKLRQLLEVSAAAFNLVRMRRLAPVVG